MKHVFLVVLLILIAFTITNAIVSDNNNCTGEWMLKKEGYACKTGQSVYIITKEGESFELPKWVHSPYSVVEYGEDWVSYFYECYYISSVERYYYHTKEIRLTWSMFTYSQFSFPKCERYS